MAILTNAVPRSLLTFQRFLRYLNTSRVNILEGGEEYRIDKRLDKVKSPWSLALFSHPLVSFTASFCIQLITAIFRQPLRPHKECTS